MTITPPKGSTFARGTRKVGAHLSRLGAAPWTTQGEEAKNHLETQAAEVENIDKFGNVSSVGQISEY